MTHDKDEVEGRGPWMHTSLGGRFFPADPRPEEVFISDIANGLALDCRYAGQGQVDRYYSVAEHSALMARYFLRRDQPWAAYVALLHDASEAYLNDLAHAVKQAVGDAYFDLEQKVQQVVWKKYDLIWPADAYGRLVKDADRRIVPLEKAAIMRYSQVWAADALMPLEGVRVRCLAPRDAKLFFVAVYHSICRELKIKPEEVEI